jgi:hypothetical protein
MGRVPARRHGAAKAGAAASLAALGFWAALTLGACKQDCSEEARLGDFEYSQGNYANAIKHYEKALRANAKCGVVGDKLAEAKRKAEAEK